MDMLLNSNIINSSLDYLASAAESLLEGEPLV